MGFPSGQAMTMPGRGPDAPELEGHLASLPKLAHLAAGAAGSRERRGLTSGWPRAAGGTLLASVPCSL